MFVKTSSLVTYLSAYSMQKSQQRADTNYPSSALSLLSTRVLMTPVQPLQYKSTRAGVSIFGKYKRNHQIRQDSILKKICQEAT